MGVLTDLLQVRADLIAEMNGGGRGVVFQILRVVFRFLAQLMELLIGMFNLCFKPMMLSLGAAGQRLETAMGLGTVGIGPAPCIRNPVTKRGQRVADKLRMFGEPLNGRLSIGMELSGGLLQGRLVGFQLLEVSRDFVEGGLGPGNEGGEGRFVHVHLRLNAEFGRAVMNRRSVVL